MSELAIIFSCTILTLFGTDKNVFPYTDKNDNNHTIPSSKPATAQPFRCYPQNYTQQQQQQQQQ